VRLGLGGALICCFVSADYAIIMAGEIDMMLDTGTVRLKAGDVVVQQAANHAWLNHGKEPCRIAFVLMD
jgi:uncharacterized cupin superfamily protein